MISLASIFVCFTLGLLSWQLLPYITRRRFRHKYGCELPRQYPQYESFLGLGLMLEYIKASKSGRLLEQARLRFQRMGPTFGATIAGVTIVNTIEPINAKTIFAEKFDDFDVGWWRRRAFAPAMNDVLFTADGPTWYYQRAMLRPALNKQHFSNYAFHQQEIDNLIHDIPKDESTIDMAPLFHTHAIAMITRLLFDEPLTSSNLGPGVLPIHLVEAFNQVNKGVQKTLFWRKLAALQPRNRAFEAACKTIHEFGDVFLQKALTDRKVRDTQSLDKNEENQNRYIFINELAKENNDHRKLRDQLLAILLVGSETTARLLVNCLWHLSRRPELWAKLRREATAMGSPSSGKLTSFPLLNQVINEALRLYPIVPTISRIANKDTFLPSGGGCHGDLPVFVPKGTYAVVNLHSLHRRPEIFGSDPEEFKPERWAAIKPPGAWDFMPFGGGPRICIGQQFAITETSYTLIRLLQVFPTLMSRDERPWKESITVSHTNGNGAKVAFGAS